MTLPHFGHVKDVVSYVSLVAAIFAVVEAIFAISRVIRSDPTDRAFRFVVLALATFFFGGLVVRILGVSLPALIAWILLFWSLTGCAVYFGMAKWLARRRRPS